MRAPRGNKHWNLIKKVHTEATPEACYEWPYSLGSKGYGATSILGFRRAHRASYALIQGCPLPKIVMHTCDNRKCINPYHLASGDDQKNVDDMRSKDRHAYGERYKHSVFTQDDVDYIRSTYVKGSKRGSGTCPRDIADHLGKNYGSVRRIARGLDWGGTPSKSW